MCKTLHVKCATYPKWGSWSSRCMDRLRSLWLGSQLMAKLACPATVSPPPTISFPQHFKPWELRLSSICFRSNTLSEQCIDAAGALGGAFVVRPSRLVGFGAFQQHCAGDDAAAETLNACVTTRDLCKPLICGTFLCCAFMPYGYCSLTCLSM